MRIWGTFRMGKGGVTYRISNLQTRWKCAVKLYTALLLWKKSTVPVGFERLSGPTADLDAMKRRIVFLCRELNPGRLTRSLVTILMGHHGSCPSVKIVVQYRLN